MYFNRDNKTMIIEFYKDVNGVDRIDVMGRIKMSTIF